MSYEVTVTGNNAVSVDISGVSTISVDVSQVGQQGVKGVNYISGGWVVSTAYSASDVLVNNGTSYICLLSHTSASTDEPGVGVNTATYWDVFSESGADGADGTGFTGGSYSAGTGVVTFTSDDGLGFVTGDLRGANGADGIDGADGTGFTGGSYNAGTGVVTFTSDDGLGFVTGDLRGADGAGSLSSVDITGGTGITSTGGPITTTGAITVALDAATQTSLGLADTALQSAAIGVSIQGYSAVLAGTTASYTVAEASKLAGIEAAADVTDTANVTAAGALMDSEVTNLTAVKAFDPTDYATAAQGTAADTAVQPSSTDTLTNKTINLTSNTISGTTAQFNTALSDGSFATLAGTETLTNKTLTDPAITAPTITGTVIEDVFALTGTTPALEPANGSIQTWTLTAASTPTDSLAAGEAITLMIDDGTAYTITWPTMTWVNNAGSAPTLATTGYTVIALWKVSTTLYGALVGDGS